MNPSAANESKDAITERIISTVNMMKEVLQSNLSLRETISKHQETIESLHSEMFQVQTENERIREKLQFFEDIAKGQSDKAQKVEIFSKMFEEKKLLENRVKVLE